MGIIRRDCFFLCSSRFPRYFLSLPLKNGHYEGAKNRMDRGYFSIYFVPIRRNVSSGERKICAK